MTCIHTKKPAALLAVFLLAGCATLDSVERSAADQASQAENKVKEMKTAAATGAVWRTEMAKIAGAEIKVAAPEVLPQAFSRPFGYTTAVQSFDEILDTLSQRTGILMRLEETSEAPSPSAAASTPAVTLTKQSDSIQVEWTGTLRGLLDYLARLTGRYWKYENGQVVFFVEETRSFHVYLPTGKRNLSASISLSALGGSSGGSTGSGGGSMVGGGGSNVSVSSKVDVDPYDAIVKGILAITRTGGAPSSGGSGAGGSGANGGGKVVANPDLGLITVTATPPVLDRVAEYVDSVNKRFAKNVMIDVKIFNITLNDEASAGIKLDLIYSGLNNYGIRTVGQPILQPKIGAPSSMIIENTNPSSSLFNSTALAQALRGLGKVSLVTSGQVITANGQPAPMQVANQVTYLSSTSTTQTTNVGVTNTLTPGTVTVGFTANFLPMVLGDNRILLQYQINMSSLLSMDQISSGNSSIQAPNIATQSLQQQAFLRDGQAIVLFGYENGRTAAAKSASFSGASHTASQEKLMSVIVMQVYGGGRENI